MAQPSGRASEKHLFRHLCWYVAWEPLVTVSCYTHPCGRASECLLCAVSLARWHMGDTSDTTWPYRSG